MADFGMMRSLSEDSGNNLNHVHVDSLCDVVSDFLETLDGSDCSNRELIDKRLSESEVAILECGLLVADIKNITEDIDQSFISRLEHDKTELCRVFGNLERISDRVLPQLDTDLNAIEELVGALELRHREFRREKSIGWLKSFLPTGAVSHRDDHAKYAHQIATCKLHPAEAHLRHFEDGTGASDVASTVTGSSGSLGSPDSGDLKSPTEYEVL